MKFKFSLQKVLEHRKLKEDLAQKEFQDFLGHLHEEIGKLQQLEKDIYDAQTHMGKLSQEGGHQGPALVQVHEFIKGQKVRIERQKARVQEAEKLVEAKREILRQAVLDYKIMDKMRENKFEEYKQERLSQEQKEMDEQSILRFKSKELK